MFFLRHKTKLADTGFFRDFVDSHSHILSGVDDGIRTIEESLTVLAYFDSLGVKKGEADASCDEWRGTLGRCVAGFRYVVQALYRRNRT